MARFKIAIFLSENLFPWFLGFSKARYAAWLVKAWGFSVVVFCGSPVAIVQVYGSLWVFSGSRWFP